MQPITYDNLVIRCYQHGSTDDRKGYILRHDVLSLSPSVGDRTLEFIFGSHDDEVDQIKLGAFLEDGIVGTLCLVPKADGTAMIQQFAVTAKLQGMGIGKKLLDYAHATAKELGYKRIILNARQKVEGFYAKAGYIATGKKFGSPTFVLVQMYYDLS